MNSVALLFSLVLVFTIPWENAVTVSDVGTLTRVIGALAAALWLGSAVAAGGFRKPHPLHVCLSLFVLWNVLSIYWTADLELTMLRIGTYVQLLLFSLMLWDLCRTSEALRAALIAYMLGMYITVGSVIHNYLSGQQMEGFAEGRLTGSGLNACDLVLVLTLGLPIAWHLATTAKDGIKDRVVSFVSYASIPASLFAITLTATRTALFVTIPAVLFMVGTANRLRPISRILIFALLIGTLFAVQPHIPRSTIERLATASESVSGADLGGRVALWRAAIPIFLEHPLLGIGSGALLSPRELDEVVHNTFLSVLAEVGLIGFILFLIALGTAVYQALNQPRGMSSLWITIISIWTIGVCTLTWEYSKATWLFLSFVVISANAYSYHTEFEKLPSRLQQPTELLTDQLNE